MISSVTKIIDKIGEIFTVFDFSYIVSGIASFSIICYGLWQNDLLGSLGSTSLNVIAAIIFTYLCGLLSFTIGKTIRATVIMYRRKHYVLLVKVEETRFMTCFKEAVRYANKKEKILADYTDEDDCKMYYTEMWTYLRECENAAATMAFINKYWVMQAVYEGLIASSLIGLIVGFILYQGGFGLVCILLFLASGFASCFCCHEGTRYAEVQIKEIVIAYRYFKLKE